MIVVRGIPVYWGVETEAVDRSFLTRATMEEALPPYRYSVWGCRIRLSRSRWLHFGLCRYKDTVTPWGLEVNPDQIGAWGRGAEEEEDDPGSLSVRSLREGGPDRPPGGDDDAQRGAVPGVESLGPGSDVGAEPDGDADGDGAGSHTGIAAEGGSANVLR